MLRKRYHEKRLIINVDLPNIGSKEEIFTLNPYENVVHITFRPSNKDIFELVEACPKIEVIQLPQSYKRTVSRSIEMFLKLKGIQILEGGHRRDMDEYFSIPYSIIEKIRKMKIDGKSTEVIGEKLSMESRLNPEMVAYIVDKEVLA
jgi:hypothetical protein